MLDKGHAISAKRLARKNRKDGNLTKDEFDRIARKAGKVISSKADHRAETADVPRRPPARERH